jgi:hypothetical protein
MTSLVQTAPSPEQLTSKNPPVSLIVISNGSHAMIRSYRRLFRLPFELFVDPTLATYRALGMTLQTAHKGADEHSGAYAHHSKTGGIAMLVGNALRARMPVWEYGGHASQLGGEFVLGPGLRCSYAHRMTNTRGHESVDRLLIEAGVDSYTPKDHVASSYGLMEETKIDVGEAEVVEVQPKSLDPKPRKLRRKTKAKSYVRMSSRYSQSNWMATLQASLVVLEGDYPSESLDPEGLVPSSPGEGFEFDPFDDDTLALDDDNQSCITCESNELLCKEQPVILLGVRTRFSRERGVIRDLSKLCLNSASSRR